jgi:hypothetical protein
MWVHIVFSSCTCSWICLTITYALFTWSLTNSFAIFTLIVTFSSSSIIKCISSSRIARSREWRLFTIWSYSNLIVLRSIFNCRIPHGLSSMCLSLVHIRWLYCILLCMLLHLLCLLKLSLHIMNNLIITRFYLVQFE